MARIGARDLRRHHLALVFGVVLSGAPVTRAAVSVTTGLTRSTVSALTADLVDGGLLRDIGPGPETATGRPGHRLVPDPDGPVGVGLQIETDHVGGCLVDLAGAAGARRVRRHDVSSGGPEAAARTVRTVLRALLWDAESSGRMVAGVVAGVPGVVAADHRTVVTAPALGWSGVDLAGLLERAAEAMGATGIPVSVRSGVQMAAAVEPAVPGVTLYVGGRSEIGVVVLEDGRPRSGDAATRFGHLPARSGGTPCRCGRRGCVVVETYPVARPGPGVPGSTPDPRGGGEPGPGGAAPGPGARGAGAPVADSSGAGTPGVSAPGRSTSGGRTPGGSTSGGSTSGGRTLGGSTSGGVPRTGSDGVAPAGSDADRVLRRTGRALGMPLAAVAAPLDPVRVVLGGRFAGADPAFAAAVEAELARAGLATARLRSGSPAGDGVMRGAGRAAIESLVSDPAGWLSD